jgi:methenyltetrahydromethanopterin cyclohydrolase
MLSINREALRITKTLLDNPELYGVTIERLPSGATVIDTGLKAQGGYIAGLRITEIAMGGLGTARLTFMNYGNLSFPSIIVETSHPTAALFASQLAGWRIKAGEYSADGSGPARALACKPSKLFQKIGYRDSSDEAVLILETNAKPPDEAAVLVANACNVEPKNLYLILTSTTSLAGSIQISGRITETALFRLDYLGLDPKRALHAVGCAPIMPPHPDWRRSMGRYEDALTYGGAANFLVDLEDDEQLRRYTEQTPSSNSKDYGKPSYEIYSAVDFDFTKIDPALFAPASITLTNLTTGITHSRGQINVELLKRALE